MGWHAGRKYGRGRGAGANGDCGEEHEAMTGKKPAKGNEPKTIVLNDPDDRKGRFTSIGGSQSDHWNNTLADQAVQALWLKHSDSETRTSS